MGMVLVCGRSGRTPGGSGRRTLTTDQRRLSISERAPRSHRPMYSNVSCQGASVAPTDAAKGRWLTCFGHIDRRIEAVQVGLRAGRVRLARGVDGLPAIAEQVCS